MSLLIFFAVILTPIYFGVFLHSGENSSFASGEDKYYENTENTDDTEEILNELLFNYTGNGYSVCCNYGKTYGQTVTIPTEYNSMPVVEIEKFAFNNMTDITKVVMPNTISVIGMSAFSGCRNLREVDISSNLSTIADNAFDGCSTLEYIAIPVSVTNIDGYVFANCSNLSTLKYSGTCAQWVKIKKDIQWAESSKITSIQCSDGIIVLKIN